ncbi:MAG: hypothetical protein LBL71_02435 [Endomicrobium sp.]|jgi:PTS system mannose-specific IIA component|nr:hypothetical protein [Endomicrobium sp.]
MIKIIVTAHKDLACEFVNAVAAIAGSQSNLYFIESSSNDSLEQMRFHIASLLKDVTDKDGVLILTDIFAGSPCNAAMQACTDLKAEVISGVNLPMILSAVLMSKTCTNLLELAESVLAKGQKGIVNVNKMLKEAHRC